MWFYRLYSGKIKYLCQSLRREPREHVLAAIDATSCMARFKDTCWATIIWYPLTGMWFYPCKNGIVNIHKTQPVNVV